MAADPQRWWVYSIPAVDNFWDFLPTVEEIATRFEREGDPYQLWEEFEKDWIDAQRRARSSGWEGDFREPPRVFWLPGDPGFEYAFVWKQDNNGTTFVISPLELAYLERPIR